MGDALHDNAAILHPTPIRENQLPKEARWHSYLSNPAEFPSLASAHKAASQPARGPPRRRRRERHRVDARRAVDGLKDPTPRERRDGRRALLDDAEDDDQADVVEAISREVELAADG